MGGALVRAASKAVDPSSIFVTNRTMEKARSLAEETGAEIASAEEIAQQCGLIFLGVKPAQLQELLSSLDPILSAREDRFVLVSMAAAVSIEKLRSYCGNYPVIRIMPNTPVSVGEGTILYCSCDVTEGETAAFRSTLSAAGLLCPVEETMIDAGSALSGCGPAFAFLFMEALEDGGVRCGLRRSDARLLSAQTLLGSAKLLLESGKHPGELKDAVCSPGGTTIAGVLSLEESAFRAAAANAVVSAWRRTLEMK